MKAVVVCGVLLETDDTYLLVKESKPSAEGDWALPAGRLEDGETLQTCARREAREETGLDVTLTGFLGAHLDNTTTPLSVIFLYEATADNLDTASAPPDSEVTDVCWSSHTDLDDKTLRHPYITTAVSEYRVHGAAPLWAAHSVTSTQSRLDRVRSAVATVTAPLRNLGVPFTE